MTHHSMLCSSVTHLIEPWHDGELSLDAQVVVEGHLAVCAACSATARELQELRQLLHRHGEPAAGLALDRSLDVITQTVLSRARAERDASLTAQLSRVFEDLHFVWAGLAAVGATAACVAVIAAVLHFAPAQRDDSLSGIIAALAEPGSNRNPLRLDERTSVPRLDEADDVSSEVLESLPDPSPQNATPLMIAGVLTQEGRVSHASVLPSWEDREARRRVIAAVAGVRFQPAQRGGTPVAVNLLWLVEHTTVRGKI